MSNEQSQQLYVKKQNYSNRDLIMPMQLNHCNHEDNVPNQMKTQ